MAKFVWGKRKSRKKAAAPRRIREVKISKIRSRPKREISEEAVAGLADSIARIGIQNPISIKRINDPLYEYEVIAGDHRFAACKRLGMQAVSVRLLSGLKAKLQRHSENLHRVELTLLEKYADIVGYQKALANAEVEGTPGGVQPHDKGISQTARKFKVHRKKVQNAMAASKLGSAIKEAITAGGHANNASLISRLAKFDSSEEQERELLRAKSGSSAAPKPIGTSLADGSVKFTALAASWKKSPTRQLWRAAAAPDRRQFVDHLLSDLKEDTEWQ
jgi:ParB/RepB/Spo0J family partition protein